MIFLEQNKTDFKQKIIVFSFTEEVLKIISKINCECFP